GTLTMEDLGSFRVRVADAWSVTLGKTQLHVPPPPAGGAVLGFILNVMKGFNLTSNSKAGGQTIQTYHRYVENATYLLDGAFADRIRNLISDERTHSREFYNSTPSPERSGTTHVSVVDEDGMAVSVTSTINHIFGSALLSPRTGLILNNQLADFCGRADSLRAGEQPPSSMTPSILESSSDPIVFVDSENNLKFERGFNEKEDCITAVSDRRKMGQASGY
ncbi:hypothetical protein CRUP_013167, partial [Coryphaenoides rupestris]